MNHLAKYIIVFLLFGMMACNGNGCGTKGTELVGPFTPPTAKNPIGQDLNIDAVIAKRGAILVSTTTLVPIEEIAEVLGKEVNEILIKDASQSGPGATQSSTFFKWSDYEVDNAGILLQIMKNPLGDEYPDYVTKFIDAKRVTGEQTPEGDREYFKKLEGLGDDGSYSYAAGKYFWRLGDKVIMGVLFNSAHSEEDQYRIATTIGKKMIENYLKV